MKLHLTAATAAAAIILASSSAGADTAPAQPASGVLTYSAAFFAEQRPNTAYDMIGRVPAFSFVNTGTARGFAGNSGNVLIDGERPTSKSDDLQTILQRIPASDVDHIDVIRGGAPGIDMQGLTVIANVVRKSESSTQWVLDLQDNIFLDGHTVPGASLNFTEHDGNKTFEASATRYVGYDDSVGNGTHTVVTYDPNGKVASTFTQPAHTSGQGSGGPSPAQPQFRCLTARSNPISRSRIRRSTRRPLILTGPTRATSPMIP